MLIRSVQHPERKKSDEGKKERLACRRESQALERGNEEAVTISPGFWAGLAAWPSPLAGSSETAARSRASYLTISRKIFHYLTNGRASIRRLMHTITGPNYQPYYLRTYYVPYVHISSTSSVDVDGWLPLERIKDHRAAFHDGSITHWCEDKIW